MRVWSLRNFNIWCANYKAYRVFSSHTLKGEWSSILRWIVFFLGFSTPCSHSHNNKTTKVIIIINADNCWGFKHRIPTFLTSKYFTVHEILLFILRHHHNQLHCHRVLQYNTMPSTVKPSNQWKSYTNTQKTQEPMNAQIWFCLSYIILWTPLFL